MDMLLIIIGGIAAFVGYIWLLVACFKESILWGIGGLLCGAVLLVYGIMNFAELKVPLLLYIVGIVLALAGQAME